MHKPVGRVQFGVFEKFTSAYLFPNCTRKILWLLINNIHKKFRNGKTEETHVYHAIREKYTINCAIQGVRLIWKQKIWLAICKFLWSLTNQNAWFVPSFCTELTLFCTVFEKHCTALNQSKWRNFFMYIISDLKIYSLHDIFKP